MNLTISFTLACYRISIRSPFTALAAHFLPLWIAVIRMASNAVETISSNDKQELGLTSLSFLKSSSRLIILDDKNRIIAINEAARRFLFPSSDGSKRISSLAPDVKSLPLTMLDTSTGRQVLILLDEGTATVASMRPT